MGSTQTKEHTISLNILKTVSDNVIIKHSSIRVNGIIMFFNANIKAVCLSKLSEVKNYKIKIYHYDSVIYRLEIKTSLNKYTYKCTGLQKNFATNTYHLDNKI